MELTRTRRPPRAAARGAPWRQLVATTLLWLLTIGPAVALPVVLVDGPPVAGSRLTVEPAVLRPAAGTTAVVVGLGAEASAPVVLTLRAGAVEVTPEGTARARQESVSWLVVPSASTLLRPGERVRVPVVVSDAPPDGVGAVVVRGRPSAGPATEVTALVLGSGDPGTAGPVLTATRGEGVVGVEVAVARPSLVTVSVAARGADATLPDRVVVPAAPLRVEVDVGSLPLPVAVGAVDDAGREATAVTPWSLPPAVAAGVVASTVLLVVGALVLVRARRRR